MAGLVATAETDIAAPRDTVWAAVTEPEHIAKYMFGTLVETDWQVGSPITWKGEWEGRAYEDKGEVLAFDPPTLMRVTHYSPLSGAEDVPENYHTVTYELTDHGTGTHVVLSQDNNATDEEVEHSTKNWSMMLASLKQTVEA